MRTECPYCGTPVDVTRLAEHVRLTVDDEHGPHQTVPERDMDNPWNLRLEFSDPDGDSIDERSIKAEVIKNSVRGGRCPACDGGVVGLKGGEGFLSQGRRRLACINCGWESPEWIDID